jgi:hypothetical protein
MMRWLARLYALDNRWLYAGTVLVLLIPFVLNIPIPGGNVSLDTKHAFELLDSCPPDKVVLLDSSWDAGSAAENRAELEALVTHLIRKRTRFVVTSIAVTPFGPDFADGVIKPLAEAAGYVYGRDWVNMGYVAGPPAATRGGLGVIIERACRDFHGQFPVDRHGTPVSELPLLEHVRTIDDIHACACITYQPNDDWMSVVYGVFHGRFIVCCMSIVGPYYQPYLLSGQAAGALVGNRGAAEYELQLQTIGRGTRLTMAGSFGNCAIILAALVGNLGWWADRRLRRAAA